MKNIKIIKTEDGSLGLYNCILDEVYHSKFGAKKEAIEKFINPILAFDYFLNKPLKILDICYGIGYNTKCALEKFKNIELIDCIEINKELVLKSFEFEFDEKINAIIKQNIKHSDFIHFYIDDARSVVKTLNKKYDIIFHDGFAPHKQAVLWSREFIFEIARLMDENSIYCTYNHSKPVLNALYQAGLKLGKTIKDNKTIGTVASYNKNLIQNPLDDYELGMLKTKSAICYEDKNLNLAHEQILNLRSKKVENSTLETLSAYIKKNKSMP